MKKSILVLATVLATSLSYSQMTYDQKFSLVAGVCVGNLSNGVANLSFKDPKKAFLLSMGITTSLGLAKELFYRPNNPDFKVENVLLVALGGLAITVPTTALVIRNNKRELNKEL